MTFAARPKHLLATFALLLGSLAIAQAPAAKPSNATGQCKDGSYSTAASKSGACRGHNGVKDWYVATAAPAASAKSATTVATPTPAPVPTAKAPTPTATVKPAPTPVPPTAAAAQALAKPTAAKGPKANLANTPVAPGGGPGLVWVNTSSNVYHCPGTDFYGKTKAGSYMSESAAKAKGARPDHGNACSK